MNQARARTLPPSGQKRRARRASSTSSVKRSSRRRRARSPTATTTTRAHRRSGLTEPSCDDGNACTEEGSCLEGVCEAGEEVVCFSNNPCIIDSCDPELGCVTEASTESCDDGSDCTLDDVCFAGECRGIPKNCDDGDPCTSETCEDLAGCVYSSTTPPALMGTAARPTTAARRGSARGPPSRAASIPCAETGSARAPGL